MKAGHRYITNRSQIRITGVIDEEENVIPPERPGGPPIEYRETIAAPPGYQDEEVARKVLDKYK
eukprot:3415120-Amphidinium_carterae.1